MKTNWVNISQWKTNEVKGNIKSSQTETKEQSQKLIKQTILFSRQIL